MNERRDFPSGEGRIIKLTLDDIQRDAEKLGLKGLDSDTDSDRTQILKDRLSIAIGLGIPFTAGLIYLVDRLSKI